jgi:DNA-binding GntR family transcriptional regulator
VVQHFGISRTPVREALLRLWADGLVVLPPNRGARVAPLDVSNLRHFYEALELCQRACMYWAALRATPAQIDTIREEMLKFEAAVSKRDGNAMAHDNLTFHNAIGAAAGNTYIASAYDRILREGMRISKFAVTNEFDEKKTLASHLNKIIRDHRDMVAAIQRKDVVRAEKLGASHAKLARLRTMEGLTASQAAGVSLSHDVSDTRPKR